MKGYWLLIDAIDCQLVAVSHESGVTGALKGMVKGIKLDHFIGDEKYDKNSSLFRF